jgi:hydrogenase maturation protease
MMTEDLDICMDAPLCWIIAYGNPYRGDDGIGPFVAKMLRLHFDNAYEVGIRTMSQLDMAFLEEVQSADTIIFVDTSRGTDTEVRWSPVEPELNGWAIGSHHLTPDIFLGFLQVLYNRNPSAWMVSVPGFQFALGQELSPAARHGAEVATLQIVDWLFRQNIALPHNTLKED